MKKKVFISFDYDDDKHYRYLLLAWIENPNIDIDFQDRTPQEIASNRVDRIKAVLTQKIKESGKVLVIAGSNVNKLHPKSSEIGCKNWINFEVAKAIENKKTIVIVKIDEKSEIPYIIKVARDKGYEVNGGVIQGFDLSRIESALSH